MNCQSIQNLLTDYLAGQTDTSQSEAVTQHLDQCPDCQSKLAELETVWQHLGSLPLQEPSPVLRQRFYTMLAREAPVRSVWSRIRAISCWVSFKPVPRLVMTLALFLFGIFIGDEIGGRRLQSRQLMQLGQEVQSIKQTMSIAMLQQTSSFDRMKGVSLSMEVDQPGDLLIQILFTRINTDPSVPVRLAAVDAVALFTDRENVQTLLTHSLMNQESPLVQVAIIDQLMYLKEKNALAALKMLIENQETQPDVKQYAEERLRELS